MECILHPQWIRILQSSNYQQSIRQTTGYLPRALFCGFSGVGVLSIPWSGRLFIDLPGVVPLGVPGVAGVEGVAGALFLEGVYRDRLFAESASSFCRYGSPW